MTLEGNVIATCHAPILCDLATYRKCTLWPSDPLCRNEMGPHNANVFCISSIPHLQVTSTVKKGKIYQVIQDSNKKLEFKLNCMSLLLILEKKFNPKNVTVVQATVNCFLVSASWGLPQRMQAGGGGGGGGW